MRDAIVLENISKVYSLSYTTTGVKNFLTHLPAYIKKMRKRRFWALKDISLTVRKGEAFGIMGRNGAGKSTLLCLIAGVMKPTTGDIRIEGRVAPLLELGAGFHPELTGRENIILNGVLLGMTRHEIKEKMPEIIAFSELSEFIDQPIRTYSSGMLARLGFSVAVHIDPEILLIDEILAVGDTQFQKKCLDRMLAFKKSGSTIVHVSHNIPQIKMLCDRVALIDGGRLREIKTAEEL